LLVFFSKLQTRRNGGATGEIEIQQNKMTKKKTPCKTLDANPYFQSSFSLFFLVYKKPVSFSRHATRPTKSIQNGNNNNTQKRGDFIEIKAEGKMGKKSK
jgi:hypothetical protein